MEHNKLEYIKHGLIMTACLPYVFEYRRSDHFTSQYMNGSADISMVLGICVIGAHPLQQFHN